MKRQNYYVVVNRSTVNKQGTRVKLKEHKHGDLLSYIDDFKDEIDQIHLEKDEETEPVRFVSNETWDLISKGFGKFEIKTVQILKGSEVWLSISHEENIENVQNAIRTGKESAFKRREDSLEKKVSEVYSTRTANLIKLLLEKGRNKYTPNQAKHSQLKDVLKLYPEECLLVPGFGKKRVIEVINVLIAYDLIDQSAYNGALEVINNYKKKDGR